MLPGSRGIKVPMSLLTVDLSQFGAERVRAAVQAAVEHASAGSLPTQAVLQQGAEATLKSEDAATSTYFVSILELAYLVASADGLADAERHTLAELLERLTGKAVKHEAMELHFKDLDDAVEMLGRRERLRRAAEDFGDPTRQHEALGFAAVVALADGVLAEPENAALTELGGHFGLSDAETENVVGGIVKRVRAELDRSGAAS
jgi:tellurite resistance protein